MSYRLSSRAEQDLDEVWLYVAEEASPTTADRLIDENHVVYYRHDGEVQIARVLHGRRRSGRRVVRVGLTVPESGVEANSRLFLLRK